MKTEKEFLKELDDIVKLERAAADAVISGLKKENKELRAEVERLEISLQECQGRESDLSGSLDMAAREAYSANELRLEVTAMKTLGQGALDHLAAMIQNEWTEDVQKVYDKLRLALGEDASFGVPLDVDAGGAK